MSTRDDLFDDGNMALAIGELEEAVRCYSESVALDPGFYDGWHALGMAQMKLGRYPEAIEAGLKACEINPNDQMGWTSLSLAYVRDGKIAQAESAGTKAKIISWGGKVKFEVPKDGPVIGRPGMQMPPGATAPAPASVPVPVPPAESAAPPSDT
ncbi:hypothetical protein DB346_24570 [Verrucomicrobia bacterium LW23]|nr:hypothetical protein DB346_24570 [Verrucomicrobia bacterium LW23]